MADGATATGQLCDLSNRLLVMSAARLAPARLSNKKGLAAFAGAAAFSAPLALRLVAWFVS